MTVISESPDEKRYAKLKRPYEFGSLSFESKSDGAGFFNVAAARVMSPFPNAFRQAVYPNGRLVVQGAYAWSQGSEGGVIWKDLPLVFVNDEGQEIQ